MRGDPFLPYSGRGHQAPVAGAPALEAIDLVAGYPDDPAPAIRDIRLRVPAGARVALVGPNGAGKSTVLKVAAGVLPVRSGSIEIYGHPPRACHHRVAYLTQRDELDWRFPITVRRLVLTGRYVHLGWLRRAGRRDREVVDSLLERLRLADVAERLIGQLSGGQQQRALLARALAQEADLLLLDEPLNAVDQDTRRIIGRLFDELKAQGKTLVIATHDIGRLEADFDGALYLMAGTERTPPPGGFVGRPIGREVF